jgi:hypothetical protein
MPREGVKDTTAKLLAQLVLKLRTIRSDSKYV